MLLNMVIGIKKRIVILGDSGFIGARLHKHYLSQSDTTEVYGFSSSTLDFN